MGTNKNNSKEELISKARLGLMLMGGIWSVFGLITLFRMDELEGYGDPNVGIVFGIFMFGNALAFIVAGWGLGKYPRIFIILAIFLCATNFILSFTDQIGFFDIATAGIDIYLLFILSNLGRKTFFAKH